MDRTPGGGPSDSMNHCDFSADELEVADTLTRLNFLIPLYDFLKFGILPPLWGSKRLRSACEPDRQRTESVVATACPVISCGVNPRNVSPDSPLLLKASPASVDGAQGNPGIVVEPPRENEVTQDPSSASDSLPNGGAHASPSSPLRASGPMLLFDLNLTPPDYSDSGIQSPLPDEDGTPCLPPSDGEVEVNGSNKAEATGAARRKRSRDMEGEIPQGCCIGDQGTLS